MSATISLKHTMARGTDATSSFAQYFLMFAGLLFLIGFVNVFVGRTQSGDGLTGLSPDLSSFAEYESVEPPVEAGPQDQPAVAVATATAESVPPPVAVLSPRMQGALDYVKRRYHVSSEALVPVFELAQMIGKERRIDPLLIVAIIGVESGFNPFAESTFGAQGLMQIIPRFHQDKVPDGAGNRPLLDPMINIRVGVLVLQDAIKRRGSLIAGLQSYAGSSDDDGSYASKVLAEKERLEQAARRNPPPNA